MIFKTFINFRYNNDEILTIIFSINLLNGLIPKIFYIDKNSLSADSKGLFTGNITRINVSLKLEEAISY